MIPAIPLGRRKSMFMQDGEFHQDLQLMQLAMRARKGEITTFITPNLIMFTNQEEGMLKKVIGTTVKAEQIELNHVKVTKGDEVHFFELGEHVKWMEVE